MPSGREIRSMPDPAFAISTICGSIASYFGVRFSKTTTSRRPRDAFPSIVQRSVFRNSRMVAVGSSPPGLLLPANRQAVLDSLSRRSRADNVVSTSSVSYTHLTLPTKRIV